MAKAEFRKGDSRQERGVDAFQFNEDLAPGLSLAVETMTQASDDLVFELPAYQFVDVLPDIYLRQILGIEKGRELAVFKTVVQGGELPADFDDRWLAEVMSKQFSVVVSPAGGEQKRGLVDCSIGVYACSGDEAGEIRRQIEMVRGRPIGDSRDSEEGRLNKILVAEARVQRRRLSGQYQLENVKHNYSPEGWERFLQWFQPA